MAKFFIIIFAFFITSSDACDLDEAWTRLDELEHDLEMMQAYHSQYVQTADLSYAMYKRIDGQNRKIFNFIKDFYAEIANLKITRKSTREIEVIGRFAELINQSLYRQTIREHAEYTQFLVEKLKKQLSSVGDFRFWRIVDGHILLDLRIFQRSDANRPVAKPINFEAEMTKKIDKLQKETLDLLLHEKDVESLESCKVVLDYVKYAIKNGYSYKSLSKLRTNTIVILSSLHRMPQQTRAVREAIVLMQEAMDLLRESMQ